MVLVRVLFLQQSFQKDQKEKIRKGKMQKTNFTENLGMVEVSFSSNEIQVAGW